jgi:hypothetical protein
MPERVQYRRGERLPPNTIYVGRPSRWGNPFKVSVEASRSDVVDLFEAWAYADTPQAASWREELKLQLRGKDLACWCPVDGKPCHADVLLRLANA